MTGEELLAIARKGRPNVRYALNRNGTAIAAWAEPLGRWQVVAGKLLTGEWASLPYELLVNGEPVHKQEDWIEEGSPIIAQG